MFSWRFIPKTFVHPPISTLFSKPEFGRRTTRPELTVADGLERAIIDRQASAAKLDDLSFLWLLFKHLRVVNFWWAETELSASFLDKFSHFVFLSKFAPLFRLPTCTTAFFPVGLLPATRVHSSSSSSSFVLGGGWLAIMGALEGPGGDLRLGKSISVCLLTTSAQS